MARAGPADEGPPAFSRATHARATPCPGRPCRTHEPGGPPSPMDASTLQLIIPIAGVVAVLFALYLARDVLGRDTGTQAMQDVAGTIFEGAVAFIRRQYTTIAILAVVGAVVIPGVIPALVNKQVADT